MKTAASNFLSGTAALIVELAGILGMILLFVLFAAACLAVIGVIAALWIVLFGPG